MTVASSRTRWRTVLTVAATLCLLAATPAVAGQASALDILGALNELTPTPNTAWGLDPDAHQVVLTVSDAAPAAGAARLAEFAGRYGDQVRIRHTSHPLTEQIMGGDEINNGAILCSAGFNVTIRGRDYLVTAGHCTARLPNWQGLGPSVASNFPGTDFGLIANESGFAPGAVDLYNGSTRPITSVGTARVGEQVCASGRTTAVTCGQVTAVDQTVDFGDGDVVHGLIQTTVHTDHGDSGGPLFDGSAGLGTVSGGDGDTDYFQPLAPVLTTYAAALR